MQESYKVCETRTERIKVETDKSTITVRDFNALSKQMIEQLEKKIRIYNPTVSSIRRVEWTLKENSTPKEQNMNSFKVPMECIPK